GALSARAEVGAEALAGGDQRPGISITRIPPIVRSRVVTPPTECEVVPRSGCRSPESGQPLRPLSWAGWAKPDSRQPSAKVQVGKLLTPAAVQAWGAVQSTSSM